MCLNLKILWCTETNKGGVKVHWNNVIATNPKSHACAYRCTLRMSSPYFTSYTEVDGLVVLLLHVVHVAWLGDQLHGCTP